MSPLRAEGHANAKLIGALRNGVRDDGVKADGGERERQHREGSEEPRDEMLLLPLGLIADPLVQIGDDAGRLLIGIGVCQSEADGVKQVKRLRARAHEVCVPGSMASV